MFLLDVRGRAHPRIKALSDGMYFTRRIDARAASPQIFADTRVLEFGERVVKSGLKTGSTRIDQVVQGIVRRWMIKRQLW